MNKIKIAAVIPARMGSTRFPGKPLVNINGLPMIEHVRRRTLLSQDFSDVIVATCDKEIADVVSKFHGNVVMTSSSHIMASDRVAEAVESLDCTHVINVQGDEILVLPSDLSKMIKKIHEFPEIKYWNAIAPIETKNEISDSSVVKCVINMKNEIMYCSRDFSSLNLKNNFDPICKILGVLGYTRESLFNYSDLDRTPLEISQSIDQSRIIENGLDLFSVLFSGGYPGINEPREVPVVLEILEENKIQKDILEQILN